MAENTTRTSLSVIIILLVAVVCAAAIAIVATLAVDDSNEATQLCMLALDEKKFRALKDGDQPNLTVQETPEGKKITRTHPWLICESTCTGVVTDEGFDGSLNHHCLGLGISTTKLEIGYKKKAKTTEAP